MPLRFKNKDSLPSTPKSWIVKETGYKIPYDSVRSTWEVFIARVMAYYDANNLTKPSIPEIEDHICKQISSWACTSLENYQARQPRAARTTENYSGCKSCGKKTK